LTGERTNIIKNLNNMLPNLSILEEYVNAAYSNFGINKKRELIRLLFEISKRDGILVEKIIQNKNIKKYSHIKNELLKLRYPNCYLNSKNLFYLPSLKIDPKYKIEINKDLKFYPKNIFFEDACSNSCMLERFKKFFPESNFTRIDKLKNYIKEKSFSLKDYNARTNNVFIIEEKFDFFKDCPCTPDAHACNYKIFNLGVGCIFECTYCYLQEYTNSLGLIIPSNIEDFFEFINKNNSCNNLRIGSGEFIDSLALDHITGHSKEIIEFFRDKNNYLFEFKTKSKNIKNILESKLANNIIISWSLNPQKIINENEYYTATLIERIECASKCVSAGYKVGFHFDPIIYYKEWEKDYEEVVNLLFDEIPENKIAWISLGTLRFNPSLKKVIENRFPENKILDTELILGFDNKLRYDSELRFSIYEKMKNWIKKRSQKIWVYLCMENK
jgi:spore photoproduct lyase